MSLNITMQNVTVERFNDPRYSRPRYRLVYSMRQDFLKNGRSSGSYKYKRDAQRAADGLNASYRKAHEMIGTPREPFSVHTADDGNYGA